jgi:glucose/arabinose dehydrogenase
MKPHRLLLAFVALSFAGCGGGSGGGGASSGLKAEIVVSGLSFPTCLRFTPGGDIIFTEKSTGRVRKIVAGVLQPDPIATIDVDNAGERGLLGLVIDPDYTSNHFIYVFYTNPGGTTNQVVRLTDAPSGPNPTIIVPNLPAANNHDGGRLALGPDGKLYVTLGENGDPANSQDSSTPAGKVLRYNLDGSIPNDNPIPGNPLFTKGHRNCFGLAIDSSGVVFVSENGPNCDDEVNRLVPGGNYGWRPDQPCNDSDPGFLQPLQRFPSVIAPTGIAIGSGIYSGSLLMGSFNDSKLRKISLDSFPSGEVSSTQVIFSSSDAIVDTTMGPDGNIYIATTDLGSNGKIVRLVP